jgi:hypothetical protein
VTIFAAIRQRHNIERLTRRYGNRHNPSRLFYLEKLNQSPNLRWPSAFAGSVNLTACSHIGFARADALPRVLTCSRATANSILKAARQDISLLSAWMLFGEGRARQSSRLPD